MNVWTAPGYRQAFQGVLDALVQNMQRGLTWEQSQEQQAREREKETWERSQSERGLGFQERGLGFQERRLGMEEAEAERVGGERQEERARQQGLVDLVRPGGEVPGTGRPPELLQGPQVGRPGMVPGLEAIARGAPGGVGRMFGRAAEQAETRPPVVAPGMPGRQYSPMEAALWEHTVKGGGPITPETALSFGVMDPSQAAGPLQQKLGYQRTPVGQEEWDTRQDERAFDQLVRVHGMQNADAQLALAVARFGFEKEQTGRRWTELDASEKAQIAMRQWEHITPSGGAQLSAATARERRGELSPPEERARTKAAQADVDKYAALMEPGWIPAPPGWKVDTRNKGRVLVRGKSYAFRRVKGVSEIHASRADVMSASALHRARAKAEDSERFLRSVGSTSHFGFGGAGAAGGGAGAGAGAGAGDAGTIDDLAKAFGG